jgi:hypothetical protein
MIAGALGHATLERIRWRGRPVNQPQMQHLNQWNRLARRPPNRSGAPVRRVIFPKSKADRVRSANWR